jgi:hypothetical protein
MTGSTTPLGPYRQLDPHRIIETVDALYRRVNERFPNSGLSQLVSELQGVATRTTGRIQWIQRPNYVLRIGAGILVAAILAILEKMLLNLNQFWVNDFLSFIQMLDSALSSVVLLVRPFCSSLRGRNGSSGRGHSKRFTNCAPCHILSTCIN